MDDTNTKFGEDNMVSDPYAAPRNITALARSIGQRRNADRIMNVLTVAIKEHVENQSHSLERDELTVGDVLSRLNPPSRDKQVV